MILTIVGGGNGGHVLAALAGTRDDVEVRILTRRPEIFASGKITVERPGIGGGESLTGRVARVSSRPEDVLPGSDIVIWCGPVVATKEVFQTIAPYVQPTGKHTPYVGTLFAQGCIHLLAKKVLGPSVPFFAFQNIPWLCRTVSPGKVCSIVGRKEYTSVACAGAHFTWLKKALEPCLGGPIMTELPDFSSIVLNPANQIIHPARYWAIFKDWKGGPIPSTDIPWLYRDFDNSSAEALAGLDVELQNIKSGLLIEAPALNLDAVIPIKDRIIKQYQTQVADQSSLKTVMATNQAYSMAKTPVTSVDGGVVPNFSHRVVQDDIPHGLCVLKDIACALHQETPWIDRMIEWHQEHMGKQYLVNGMLEGRDIAETSCLSTLGGHSLHQIGFVSSPVIPCKL